VVRNLKDNFLNGRAFADMDDLRAQGQHWLSQTANTRVHALGAQALDGTRSP
jgi:hypothetical protein